MTDEEIYEQYNNFVQKQIRSGMYNTIPHCDSRILHDPSDCGYCDRPEWQKKRRELGIASTGCYPNIGEISCEADAKRPSNTLGDHRRWYGNMPTSIERDDPDWPKESSSSKMMYNDRIN